MNKPTPSIEAAATRHTTRNSIFAGLALLFCSGLAVGADLNIKAKAPHIKAKAPRPASVKKNIGNYAINTALVKAILAGDDLSIKAALSNGADVDTTIFINYGGQKPTLSAVTIATLLGDVTALRYLLDAGVRVEKSCDVGYLISVLQPLNSILPETGERKAVFDNIMRSQPELRCYLIGRYGLDPANRNHQLIAEILRGDLPAVKSLLLRGADKNARETKLPGLIVWPGRTALMIAMIERRIDIAEFLIGAGSDVNAKVSVGSTWGGWDGFTALMLASELQQNGLVKALLASGANPALADEENSRAIHFAAATGNIEALKAVIEALPTPAEKKEMLNARTKGGDTPLVLATRSRQPEAVQYLITFGKSVFGSDYLEWWGNSALMEAVTYREYGAQRKQDRLSSRQTAATILGKLLENGADANAADEDGVTVLMHAIQEKSELSVVRSLVSHRADPRTVDHSGHDAYYYARQRTDAPDVIDILDSDKK